MKDEHLDPNENLQLNPASLKEALLIKSARSAIGVGTSNKTNLCPEAHDWIFGSNQSGPFSFDNCCKQLDVDPESIRNWLRWYKGRYNKPSKNEQQDFFI